MTDSEHLHIPCKIGWLRARGTRPPCRGERVLIYPLAESGESLQSTSSMTDVQVTLSPSWVIKPTVEIRGVQSLRTRRRVNAASSSYLGYDLVISEAAGFHVTGSLARRVSICAPGFGS